MQRVLIVEDDARYRDSLRALITRTPGFALAEAFDDPRAALAWCRAREQPYDLALMDLGLPGMSGIETTRALKLAYPTTTVVVLTAFEEPKNILDAICAGADGYLLKKTPANALVAQLRSIADGGAPMSAGVARSVLGLVRNLGGANASTSAQLRLTEREQDVLRGLVAGMTYREVGEQLGISVDSVRTHVRGLYRKLQVHSVAAAVARAIRDGLV